MPNALSEGGIIMHEENDELNPCINNFEYKQIEQRCAENVKIIGLTNDINKSRLKTTLNWPLKPKAGLDDCSYYIVSAHVDHNSASGSFTDYNCGSKTYDGHRGTDIAIFPYPFYKLDHDEVEVVAAATGTIIDKVDGNFDKNCSSNNLQANYLVVQHTDGSRVLYFHMKKNSLTKKAIGQSVDEGEYLGIVGSSGNSSGPHLHFEVWSGNTVSSMVDPYAGSCNSLNNTTWWADQKPYTEAAIVKASVNNTDIVIPACPSTESSNEAECFTIPFQGPGLPSGFAKFYIFFRNETQGLTAELNITNPDGSVYTSWTYTSTNSYKQSYRSWSKSLPTLPGTYTFNTSYNGISCSKKFNIVKAVISANAPPIICEGASLTLQAIEAQSYLWNTGDTTQTIAVTSAGDYKVTITNVKGCTAASEPFYVKVNTLPIANITPNGPTTFCLGESVELTSENAFAYAWSNGSSNKKIIVADEGEYKITVTDENGCKATDSLTIIVNEPENGLKILVQNDTLISPYGDPSIWFFNGSNQPVDTGDVIICKQSGIFSVAGPDNNGCYAVSDTITLKCNTTSIINPKSARVILFPNPSAEKVYFKLPTTGNFSIIITDIFGRNVLNSEIFNDNHENLLNISVSWLPDGIYFLNLTSQHEILLSSFIKTSCSK